MEFVSPFHVETARLTQMRHVTTTTLTTSMDVHLNVKLSKLASNANQCPKTQLIHGFSHQIAFTRNQSH